MKKTFGWLLLVIFVQTVSATPSVLRIETLSGLRFPEKEPIISVDLHTLESSEVRHYWIEFCIIRPNQYSTMEFPKLLPRNWTMRYSDFKGFELNGNQTGYSKGKLSQATDLGSKASIGYYFGYEFDDGWILMSDGSGMWMEEETLEEFDAFLQSVSTTLNARLKVE